MKRLFLFLFTFFMVGSVVVNAQDVKAIKKALKPANKALSKLKTDPTNETLFNDAKAAVAEVFKMDGADKVGSVWKMKGNIHSAVVDGEMAVRAKLEGEALLAGKVEGKEQEVDYTFKNPLSAVKAFEALSKAYNLTEKKSAKTVILKDLEVNCRALNDLGFYTYQAKDYKTTYHLFSNLVKSNAMLKANGGQVVLEDDTKVEDMTFYAAVAAQLGGMKDEANGIYKQLYDGKTKKIEVYEQLFTATIDSDEKQAMKYLEEGRAIDPENVSLLFAEINYYLKKGNYEVLEGKLAAAMEKEPENATLRSVMGRVYNDFYQKEEDAAKKDGYFAKAEKYYKEALEIDPESFDALYSLGELHYNSAAGLMKEWNDLPLSATQREADALKGKFMQAFENALPYFLKADELNPKDQNTLIALREIYVRKDDLAKSKVYKDRLEALK